MSRLHWMAASTVAVVAAWGASASASPVLGRPGLFVSHGVFHALVCPTAAPGMARCHAHIVTDSTGSPLLNRMETRSFGRGAPAGYAPSDLRSAYKVTSNGAVPGTIIAIVDAYGYPNAESDLAVYRSQFQLGTCSTSNGCFGKYNEVGAKGAYPQANLGWEQETALDLDMASAMCPSCKIILVEANSATYADLAAAENTAAALGAHVISNSYGGGESGSKSFASAYNHPGVAITVSTGDSGYGAAFPATAPTVTAVGGTSLYRASNNRGWTETAWADGGSGCSGVYSKPSWQHDVLCTMRMEADVSAVADPYTGVAVYGPVNNRSSAWLVFGGTSVSAPLVGGIYANNGGAVTTGTYSTPIPYTQPGALNDITSGANGSCGGTYFCTAGTGYDGPTGLGTPLGTTAF